MMYPNMADRFHDFSHSTPEITNVCHQNLNFTNHTYEAAQTRGHAQHTTPFRMTNTSYEPQSFHHRGSFRLDGSLYGSFPCEYYNHSLNNSIITSNCPVAIPFGQERGTIYNGSL